MLSVAWPHAASPGIWPVFVNEPAHPVNDNQEAKVLNAGQIWCAHHFGGTIQQYGLMIMANLHGVMQVRYHYVPYMGMVQWAICIMFDKDLANEKVYHPVCHCSLPVCLLLDMMESDTIVGNVKSRASQTTYNIKINGITHISDASEHTLIDGQYQCYWSCGIFLLRFGQPGLFVKLTCQSCHHAACACMAMVPTT